jgi:subtilisin family serine protease
MKIIGFLFLLCVSLVAGYAPLHVAENGELLDGSYIVIFNSDITEAQVASHMETLRYKIASSADNSSTVTHIYNIGSFRGYAAQLTPEILEHERDSEDVAYVEVDQIARIDYQDCRTQNNADWGLDRISTRTLVLDGNYIFPGIAGQGTDAYIVDTGVRITHNEFAGGRAKWGSNFVGDGIDSDCNGHGTHVAGTIAGQTYGVAKAANVIAVKVLGCGGSGSYAGVIGGVQYVATQYGTTKRPSTANLSLGGGKSVALEDAIKAGTTAGVTYLLAAGNSNSDACLGSPSGVGGTAGPAITVGSTNRNDVRSSFSSYGKCVDVFAPGELITSAWSTSDTDTRTISGTSMATPHVAGVTNLYLSLNPSARDSKTYIPNSATPNILNLNCGFNTNCQASPNKLLYSPCT